ncbi:MAG: hypothetical protein VX929_14445 [Pseudomonadota bacterium]|nr:hypothetical protein [Pseudomonadota bacterium]
MSTIYPERWPSLKAKLLRLAVFGAVLVYTTGFLLWYSATPLGLFPVLDGREILSLAVRIAGGDLPAEPFYRAPLYPALLGVLVEAGVAQSDLPFAARVLNGVLHLVNTFLVWRLAGDAWRSDGAAAIAAVLYGLNPVVLHFVVDPLDITLGMSLMLVAFSMVGSSRLPDVHAGRLALASACCGLAVLTRPQMATILLAWFAIVAWSSGSRSIRVRTLLAGLLPALVLLGTMGAINHALSGEFRVLPWQGAFNLWSANRPGAHGRYFEQSSRVSSYEEGTNPARLESERLYRQLHVGVPLDRNRMSRFWRERTVAYVLSEPGQWMRLLVSKAYYLVNNFEQYNNKTYQFHKRRSFWLQWNPIGWVWVLSLGAAGIVSGWRQARVKRLMLFAAVYAAGLIITYVSARFRLPLVPLMAVMAGGIAVSMRTTAARIRTGLIVVGVFCASSIPMATSEREKTYLQDHLLLARANLSLGHHAAAIVQARAALNYVPDNDAARELICVAEFNHWLYGAQSNGDLPRVARACEQSTPSSDVARRIAGIMYWRLDRDEDAVNAWSKVVREDSPERPAALAALLMTGHADPADIALDWVSEAKVNDVLLLAMMARGDAHAASALSRRMDPDEIKRQIAALKKTFERSP